MGGGTRGRGRTGEEEGPISKEVVARAGSGSKVCEEAVAADNEIGLASISPHTVTWSTCTHRFKMEKLYGIAWSILEPYHMCHHRGSHIWSVDISSFHVAKCAIIAHFAT